MARAVDPDVLVGFVEEARGYLPAIRQSIDRFGSAPDSPESLEEAHRHVHTIKGAAAMVGLAALSHVAFQLEGTLEDAAAGKVTATPETLAALHEAVTLLERLLDGPTDAAAGEPPVAAEAGRIFDRFQSGPETDRSEEAPTPAAAPPSPAPPAAPLSTAEDDAIEEEVSPELLEVFVLEAEDHLRNISTLLPALEARPQDKPMMQEVRRSVHTLKGSAAMVGFRAVTQLAHRMEDLLDLLYEGDRPLTPEVLRLLFASNDAFEDLIGKKAPAHTFRHLFDQYAGHLADTPAVTQAAPAAAPAPVEEAVASGESEAPAVQPAPGQFVRIPIERLDDLVKLVSELVITRSVFEQRMADFLHQVEEIQHSTERLRRTSYKLETQYEASALGSALAPANGHGLSGGFHGFDDLEFDRYSEFHLLSRELAETTSDMQTTAGELRHLLGDFDTYLARQGRQASEIEDKVMRLRMVPLGTLASRLHRTVRTVAQQQGKQVDLVLDGERVELDKTVLEALADPLLHLLRNAVDHGIEPPELRQARGKSPRGTIRLRAFHEGSQVVVQISDDGAGVDPEVLRATAVHRGFVAEVDVPLLSDEDLLALVFLPGFSTAQEISEVSGRGVGLDIVKAHVHRLKGTLNLDSSPGRGATFTIRLPMTLAIARTLLVKANQETFAVPLDAVRQILRLEADGLEHIGHEAVVRVGGEVYPVVYLARALGLKQTSEEAPARPPVLIINAGARQIGLVVDQLLGGREIVIKNLGNHLRQVHGISGATLMGDGSVVLILNPADLVRETPTGRLNRHVPTVPAARPAEALTVMIVDDSPSVRRVVTNLIRSAGWQTVVAKDGLEALEVLQQAPQPPDLLLLDIEMPRMDGYELLGTLRGQAAYRDLPVVMVTSRAGEKHRRKALDLGATEYLVKPYQDEVLLRVIRQLVRNSRQAALA